MIRLAQRGEFDIIGWGRATTICATATGEREVSRQQYDTYYLLRQGSFCLYLDKIGVWQNSWPPALMYVHRCLSLVYGA